MLFYVQQISLRSCVIRQHFFNTKQIKIDTSSETNRGGECIGMLLKYQKFLFHILYNRLQKQSNFVSCDIIVKL